MSFCLLCHANIWIIDFLFCSLSLKQVIDFQVEKCLRWIISVYCSCLSFIISINWFFMIEMSNPVIRFWIWYLSVLNQPQTATSVHLPPIRGPSLLDSCEDKSQRQGTKGFQNNNFFSQSNVYNCFKRDCWIGPISLKFLLSFNFQKYEKLVSAFLSKAYVIYH